MLIGPRPPGYSVAGKPVATAFLVGLFIVFLVLVGVYTYQLNAMEKECEAQGGHIAYELGRRGIDAAYCAQPNSTVPMSEQGQN